MRKPSEGRCEMQAYRIGELHYRARDIGYGVEYGVAEGYWLPEVDMWGKQSFRLTDPIIRDGTSTLYLFPDEVEVWEPFVGGERR
jgi:hypothetical protein